MKQQQLKHPMASPESSEWLHWEALPKGLVACPRCQTPIAMDKPRNQVNTPMCCPQCSWQIRIFAGMPWFFMDPWLKRDQWKVRIETTCETLEQDILELEKNISVPTRPTVGKAASLTLKRLKTTLNLKKFELQHLRKLLESLSWDTTDPQAPTQSPHSQERLPPLASNAFFDPMSYQQTLESYRTHAFRDWAWPGDENAVFYSLIRAAALPAKPSQPPHPKQGVALVAGCGAGRLLWDLACDPDAPWSLTVGFDINPYLLDIGHQVLKGTPLDLVEWPASPINGYQTGYRQSLALPPRQPPQGIVQLWAGDWLNPPFAWGSLATIITPWFIDILPEPPINSITRILRLLEPGGTWIFAGSTAFHHGAPPDRWSRQEFLAAVEDSGFAIQNVAEPTIPYLHSPHEAQKRWENILVFSAQKSATMAKQAPPTDHQPQASVWPPWLTDHRLPIPKISLFKNQAHHHKVLALTLDLIDGQRSVIDMAKVIAAPTGISQEAACRSVAAFLQALWEKAGKDQPGRARVD